MVRIRRAIISRCVSDFGGVIGMSLFQENLLPTVICPGLSVIVNRFCGAPSGQGHAGRFCSDMPRQVPQWQEPCQRSLI